MLQSTREHSCAVMSAAYTACMGMPFPCRGREGSPAVRVKMLSNAKIGQCQMASGLTGPVVPSWSLKYCFWKSPAICSNSDML